ncbi:MAG: putative 2,3-bisphosphoglycerate-independent phosphoglycerate mutase [Thermotoga sp. 50_1627]|uniref:2,3-bisphosphoglycerate-independent phosphoglycerate mutase n=1 Tax=Pseudothermotoga sp. TaxID=2033661 RepID=UPI00076C3EF8|nr:MAG: putative 2,3-bisphosphoglycerate-independent phosphoglycerate mutase [Thermotoga sp. 50_64]KUK24866.1 MAG: putative 2,3-bisphosphoglycerate-independent phosphoglycerate mutase [Thermotoga sp. 50_1627]MBC7116904.1 2,3-bisphosphoglycerate-independent phosphoglycerate mutase [Pseudothermotoga sp.]MDK2923713.1 2,3-bisphosphoglycerate-independent phosphoglycerate mutase [Pseudothermotoga sp.]HBT39737.1 phosphoglycerate mutase [Pseudothermotoga sp.]
MYDRQQILSELAQTASTKIVLLVMDGIGDVPGEKGKTPLQAAKKPNLDRVAKESDLGQTIPVMHGVTPGSGPGHLALFGYDPVKYQIGRGILEALGLDIAVGEKDVVARANFATIQNDTVLDRRAGRPSTEESSKVVEKLSKAIQSIEDVKVSFYAGKEHRFVVKLTGEGLDDRLSDADPQKEGKPFVYTQALAPEAERTARIVNKLLDEIRRVLSDQPKMNCALMRGFSKYPDLPQFPAVYKLKAAAIATYPMYRGIARLVGMEIVQTGDTVKEEFETVKRVWKDYDFFYVHVKKTDSYGEDGNFEAKVHVIEEVDEALPILLDLQPDVLIVTGDHSTPTPLKAHSWHPVPLMIRSKYTRKGLNDAFDEYECAKGTLGTIYAVDVMGLALAHALRLEKFGA